QAEVRDEVLADRGRFRVVHGPRQRADEPAPLKVKDVRVQGRRYVVCVNLIFDTVIRMYHASQHLGLRKGGVAPGIRRTAFGRLYAWVICWTVGGAATPAA